MLPASHHRGTYPSISLLAIPNPPLLYSLTSLPTSPQHHYFPFLLSHGCDSIFSLVSDQDGLALKASFLLPSPSLCYLLLSQGCVILSPCLPRPLAGTKHPIFSPAGVELNTLGMGLLRWSSRSRNAQGPFFFIWGRLSCCQYYGFSISSLIMPPWLGKWLVGLPDMKTLVSILCLSGHIAWVIRQPFEQLYEMFLPSPPPTSHWSRLNFILHADAAAKSVRERNCHSPSVYFLIALFKSNRFIISQPVQGWKLAY